MDRTNNYPHIELPQIERYLTELSGRTACIEAVHTLGGGKSGAAAIKAFGYGQPMYIIYRLDDEKPHEAVLRRVKRNGFGRERGSDRVAEVWRDFHNFNKLPRHVRARELVALSTDGRLRSLNDTRELMLLTDYVPGKPYANDLVRIRDSGTRTPLDVQRAQTLATYLAEIHAVKHGDPLLWRRRLRDLVGHGEGIMGLADSYPTEEPLPYATPDHLRSIEEAANRWRWQLKKYSGRLSQVHGDFHPFNILFEKEIDFWLVDRSRGEWGEPADDVSCLTINYVFFSLQRNGRFEGAFADLYTAFWETYLTRTEDETMLSVIAPWFAWRALVLANPTWYPLVTDDVRRKIINLAHNVMSESRFQWRNVAAYLGAQ